MRIHTEMERFSMQGVNETYVFILDTTSGLLLLASSQQDDQLQIFCKSHGFFHDQYNKTGERYSGYTFNFVSTGTYGKTL